MPEVATPNSGTGTAVRVLDVAEGLLQVQGYHGFSYGDVAARLGITRAALHYHFAGKSELGEALIARYSDRFAAALAELDAGGADAAGKLSGYADLYAAVLERSRMCLCGMLAAEYQTLPAGMQQRVVDFFALNAAWLRAVCDLGRRDGTLSFAGTPDDVAAMLLGGFQGALLLNRMDGDVDRFRASVDRLLAGLVSTPATRG